MTAEVIIRGEDAIQTVTVEEAQRHLGEIIDKLTPGEDVARIVGEPAEKPHRVFGRGEGMLTIVSEDDEHLKDWAEYMP